MEVHQRLESPQSNAKKARTRYLSELVTGSSEGLCCNSRVNTSHGEPMVARGTADDSLLSAVVSVGHVLWKLPLRRAWLPRAGSGLSEMAHTVLGFH